MANDVEITVRADNQTGAAFTTVNVSLRTLQRRAVDAEKALLRMQTAARDIDIKVSLDDRATASIARTRTALDELKTQAAQIRVSLDDQTGSGASRIESTLGRLKAKSAEIAVTVKDKTQAGVNAVRQGITSLRALSPVRLEVTFSGQSGEITSAARAMGDLKNNTQSAGQALGRLSTRAAAAAVSLEQVKDNAQQASHSLAGLTASATAAAAALSGLRSESSGAARALRTLDNRADSAGNRMGDLGDRTRRTRDDMDDLDNVVRRLAGNLGGLRGRVGTLSTSIRDGGGAAGRLRSALLSLLPAAIPVGAVLSSIAGQAVAATAGVAMFGAAVIPQITTLAKAAQAETKYKDSLAEHGKGSAEAAKAEQELQAALAKMPPATREAAAGFSALREGFRGWSDALSSSTMPVFTKSFATFRGMLPGFTPLVQGAATQLDRLITAAAGGVGSGGFDRLAERLTAFSNRSLKSAVDGILRFSRVLEDFPESSGFQHFLEYARRNGPIVGETLGNLGDAAVHLISASSDLGVSMLSVLNAMAKLVNAVPTSVLSTFLQLAIAWRTVRLASAGLTAAGTAVAGLGRQLVAFRAAATAAGGGVAGLRAAFLGLSAAAKTTIVVAAVGALVLALSKLSGLGRQAPPNIDRLTTALGELGRTGKTGGEAARVLGKDLDGLHDAIRSFSDPSALDKVQESLVKVFSLGMASSTPVKEARKALDSVDQALANLVKGGHSELAAAALERLKKAYAESGQPVGQFTSKLDEYKSALADAKFESDLAADAQGLFGRQAQSTQQKLDAQKASADGLRQAIQDLNDTARTAFDAQTKFEQAIDDTTASIQENGRTLDVNTERGRANRNALSELAAATDEAAAAVRENGGSWAAANQIYDRGRQKLINAAVAMGMTRAEAQRLASQILRTPDKTARLRGNLDDLKAKLADAKRRLDRAPSSKTASIRGEIHDLQRKIASAKSALSSVRSRSVSLNVTTRYYSVGQPGSGIRQLAYAHGGIVGHAAEGGPRSNRVLVGEQGPEVVDLAPGSMVRPAGESRRIMQQAGFKGAHDPIVLELHSGGTRLDDLLVEVLRKAIRVRGGNVQLALGRG